MKELTKETITLAPSIVVRKAKLLREIGAYDSALKILEENKIEFDIYATHMEVNMPSNKPRKYKFTGGKRDANL